MKKVDLLAQIEATTKGIVKVEAVLAGNNPEVLTMVSGKTARKYSVNVAVTQGESVTFQNLPIVVFNEGLADEEAVLSQGVDSPRLKDFETKAKNYLNGKVQDNTFLGYKILELSEEFKYMVVFAIENVAGTMTRKKVLVYKPSATPITHVPFVE